MLAKMCKQETFNQNKCRNAISMNILIKNGKFQFLKDKNCIKISWIKTLEFHL